MLPLPDFIYKWRIMETYGINLNEEEFDFYFIFDNIRCRKLEHRPDTDEIQIGKGTFPSWGRDPLMITLYTPELILVNPKSVEYSRN